MAKDRAAKRLSSRYCTGLSDGIKTFGEALGEIAESGRIGRPVFVRWTATVTGGDNGHRTAADTALDAISGWFGGPPQRAHDVAAADGSCLTVAWTWPRGEAALFASGPAAGDAQPAVDVTLIGSRGAAYHSGPLEMAE